MVVRNFLNVGKIYFYKILYAGRLLLKTGNKTRRKLKGQTIGLEWVKMLKLLDTPGILWPKI